MGTRASPASASRAQDCSCYTRRRCRRWLGGLLGWAVAVEGLSVGCGGGGGAVWVADDAQPHRWMTILWWNLQTGSGCPGWWGRRSTSGSGGGRRPTDAGCRQCGNWQCLSRRVTAVRRWGGMVRVVRPMSSGWLRLVNGASRRVPRRQDASPPGPETRPRSAAGGWPAAGPGWLPGSRASRVPPPAAVGGGEEGGGAAPAAWPAGGCHRSPGRRRGRRGWPGCRQGCPCGQPAGPWLGPAVAVCGRDGHRRHRGPGLAGHGCLRWPGRGGGGVVVGVEGEPPAGELVQGGAVDLPGDHGGEHRITSGGLSGGAGQYTDPGRPRPSPGSRRVPATEPPRRSFRFTWTVRWRAGRPGREPAARRSAARRPLRSHHGGAGRRCGYLPARFSARGRPAPR